MADFAFPNFSASGMPAQAFPYANFPQQLFASFNALPTASYGRFNGTGVSQDLGYPTGINPGPPNGYQTGLLAQQKIGGGLPSGLLGAAGGGANGAANFGPPPAIPNVPGSQQAFSNGQGMADAAIAHAVATAQPGSAQAQFLQRLLAMNQAQNYTPAQFNLTAGSNPAAAYQMLAQGGQAFRDAVAKQNGWTPQQLNSFINDAFYNKGGATYRG